MVKRFMAPGPWITRDLKECVLASDYDALAAENAALKAQLAYAASTGDECAIEVESLRSRLAEAERVIETVATMYNGNPLKYPEAIAHAHRQADDYAMKYLSREDAP